MNHLLLLTLLTCNTFIHGYVLCLELMPLSGEEKEPFKIVFCLIDNPFGQTPQGGTLIFSSYVSSGPASTVHPKNIRNFKHPKKYLKF